MFAKRQSLAFQCRARAAAAMSRAPREAVRPEERAGGDADKYYDREVTEAYTELNVRTQSELTTRCLDMLCLEGEARDAVLLDVGCGSGLSGETLTRQGYRGWVGIDASAAMLERATRGRSASKRTADEKEPPADDAREREDGGKNNFHEDPPARGAVLRGDFSQGLPFRAGAFDGCVSVSAAQWLCAGTTGKRGREGGGDENDDDALASTAVREKKKKNLRRFFAALRVALRPGARAALQVYPRTVHETAAFEEALARVERMRGTAVVAFPHGNASKKLFVCARRDDDDDDDDDDASRRLAPPRCLLAWPHAATCEAAWHDSLRAFRAFREKQSQEPALRCSTRARSDREHVAAQRRALRSLRRARVAAHAAFLSASRADASAERNETLPSRAFFLAPFDAELHGAVTETVDVSETIVRDGSLCPCARVGVLTSARVVSEKKKERKKNAGDGARGFFAEKPRPATFSFSREKKKNGARGKGEKKKASLEDPLSLTPLGAPQSVETRVCPRANAASPSASTVTFQEFILRTSFGDFGVFAAEAEARTIKKEGEEGVRKKKGETFFADDAASVSTRARAALGACLRGAGSMVCAAVLSRSSPRLPSVGARGEKEKEDTQVWILWWPSRVVGGASAEKNAGFRETSGLRESVRDAFS